jgi:hypothetical protein
MKTFISSIIIFALVCVFIITSSIGLSRRLSEIGVIAAELPSTEEEFAKNKDGAYRKTKELCSLWQKTMEILPYFIGYDMLQAANEAALTMQANMESGVRDDFFNARLKFCDAVSLIHEFFGISPKSLF